MVVMVTSELLQRSIAVNRGVSPSNLMSPSNTNMSDSGTGSASGETISASALHERLVAYVHAVTSESEDRCGVWMEHSYARAREDGSNGVTHNGSTGVRVLLAPRPPSAVHDHDVIDVDTCPPNYSLPSPLQDFEAGFSDIEMEDSLQEEGSIDEDWESKILASAPTAAHTHLATVALDSVRSLRLAWLAGDRSCTRTAARRLRSALAPLWARGGAAQQRPAAWLHAALTSGLPRILRPHYTALLAELRRVTPRLVSRLLAGALPPPSSDPLMPTSPAMSPDTGPWLLWMSCGRERQDSRWERRLRSLVHTRVLPTTPNLPAAPPATWCSAVVSQARTILNDAIAEAGTRPVVLGGVGAGAALCVALATHVAVSGLILLAPPLLTAEGPRDAPDDPLHQIEVPTLMVCGGGAAQSWRGAACDASGLGNGARGRTRRLVVIAGADDLLRLPRRRPASARINSVPQHALDAAIVEECVRFVMDIVENGSVDELDHSPLLASPPRVPPHTANTTPPSVVHTARHRRVRERERDVDDQEYAHLPAAAPGHSLEPSPVTSPATHKRAIEIVDGRVVSRGSGGTPLTLIPPRRSGPTTAPTGASSVSSLPVTLAPADILHLPIVFADDPIDISPPPLAPRSPRAEPESPVTVTSGNSKGGQTKFTRVIIAKRRGGSGRGSRGVVVRRAMRVIGPRRNAGPECDDTDN